MCDDTGPCLRRLVADASPSMASLARDLGVCKTTLHNWCAHQVRLSRPLELADRLGVSAAEIELARTARPCPPRRAPSHTATPAARVLRRVMERCGLGTDALVRRAGVSRTALYAALAGSQRPSPATLAKLARSLDIDVVVLAGACGEPTDTAADTRRLELGMSRTAFAAHAGLSPRLLYHPSPRPLDAARVALALGAGPAEAHAAAEAARRHHGLRSARCELGVSIDGWVAANGASRADLARRIGVSRQALEQWRNGASLPSARSAARLAEVLGVERAALRACNFPARREPLTALGRLIDDHTDPDGVSLVALAERVGVRPATLSAWRLGCSRPSSDAQARLAAALGLEAPAVAAAVAQSPPRWAEQGEALRRRRLAEGLSHEQLANRWGLSTVSVQKMEEGWQRPRPW